MQTKIGRGLALAALAASIAGFAPRAIADDETSQSKARRSPTDNGDGDGRGGRLDKRIVTLKGEDGVVSDLKVGKEVRNLAQVKKGDQVVATYHEAIAYEVFKPGHGHARGANRSDGRRARQARREARGRGRSKYRT